MRLPALIIILATLLTACANHNVAVQSDPWPIFSRIGTYYRPLVAVTDDTVNSYAIVISRNHSFVYRMTHRSGEPGADREFYRGAWKYRSDTVFLQYHKKRPRGVADYLVKEITGGWLIQFFTDGRPRAFLRIQHRPFDY